MRENMNNKVVVTGTVIKGFEFDHEAYGEKYYRMTIASERCSGKDDILPVVVSERQIDVTKDYTSQYIKVTGQFRSVTKHDEAEQRNKLELHIVAQTIESESLGAGDWDRNRIKLNGTILGMPRYRVSPAGKEICDILLTVERGYGKTDCIPCVVWGKNARVLAEQKPGTQIKINGKVRSHDYVKDGETKRAYETFISDMKFYEKEVLKEIA